MAPSPPCRLHSNAPIDRGIESSLIARELLQRSDALASANDRYQVSDLHLFVDEFLRARLT
jgi:hypothetical protein